MRLPIPRFDLPPHAGIEKIDQFKELANQLGVVGRGMHRSSEWFRVRCERFTELARQDIGIGGMIESRRDVRVVLHLWNNNNEFLRSRPPTERSLNILARTVGFFRAQHLYALSELYFQKFDLLGHANALAAKIKEGLSAIDDRRLAADLRTCKHHSDQIYSASAPSKIALQTIEKSRPLERELKSLGIPIEKKGRYVQACKNAYYIETIKGLRIGETSHIFDELTEQDVKESPYDNHFNIGQMAAATLIDRCTSEPSGMPQNWIELVIRIMGDPRRPPATRGFQKWWALMPSQHLSAMKKWLAGFDLKLFLRILKDSSSDPELDRMYPPREAFLEGLLEHHEISDARLFLGEDAARFISRDYGAEAVKNHGRLRDRTKTIIYMNVGGLHFFEGTHNCAARIGAVMAHDHPVISRSRTNFDYWTLTSGIERDMDLARRDALQKEGVVRVVHSPTTWQHNLITGFQRLGLDVRPEHVLSRSDYLWYRRRYGL